MYSATYLHNKQISGQMKRICEELKRSKKINFKVGIENKLKICVTLSWILQYIQHLSLNMYNVFRRIFLYTNMLGGKYYKKTWVWERGIGKYLESWSDEQLHMLLIASSSQSHRILIAIQFIKYNDDDVGDGDGDGDDDVVYHFNV